MAARDRKVPLAFVYGADDVETGKRLQTLVQKLKANRKDMDLTDAKEVPGAGPRLPRAPETEAFVIKYVSRALERQGAKAWVPRGSFRTSVWRFADPKQPSIVVGPATVRVALERLGVR